MPLFHTCLFETRRNKTRQQKRIVAVDRTKLYSYCDPLVQWEQWPVGEIFERQKSCRAGPILSWLEGALFSDLFSEY